MKHLLVVTLLLSASIACGGSNSTSEPTKGAPMADSGVKTLQMVDTKVGTGAEAVAGRVVRVHYTGWLFDEKAANRRGRVPPGVPAQRPDRDRVDWRRTGPPR